MVMLLLITATIFVTIRSSQIEGEGVGIDDDECVQENKTKRFRDLTLRVCLFETLDS